jgi:CheY-like chemotaxis protein
MSRRFHLILLLLFLGAATYWWFGADHGSAPIASKTTSERTDQRQGLSQEEIQRQFEALEKEKQAMLASLNPGGTALVNRDRAAVKTAEAREKVRLNKQPAWSRVLSTNWPAYQKLRAEAVSSRKGTVPCTFCDGRGKFDTCVVCDGDGKCQTCGGSGHLANGDLCPNCLGSGKCFLCGGIGKMACPFCDDGEVYAKLPPPPNQIPIFCEAPSQIVAAPAQRIDTSRLSPEQMAAMAQPVKRAETLLPEYNYNALTSGLVFLLVGTFLFYRFVRRFNGILGPLSKAERERVAVEKLIAEEPTVAAFFHALQSDLQSEGLASRNGVLVSLDEVGPQENSDQLNHQLQRFYDSVPGRVTGLLLQLSKINHASTDHERVKYLRELFQQLDVQKQESRLRALRPVWLMTCGLQGLIQQLIEKPASLNQSVLRAIAGAIGMIKALCVPGVDPALAIRQPVELLAVDDNAVCLSALSMALKKAFRKPDLAAEGISALAMAEKKQYDAIFLDIEMPGMDGFELCEKIHATELNRTTPVVFVTSHSDFESRARSELVGGQDLIGKPYLSFEITVKAMTLALRSRLASDAATARGTNEVSHDDGSLESDHVTAEAQVA